MSLRDSSSGMYQPIGDEREDDVFFTAAKEKRHCACCGRMSCRTRWGCVLSVFSVVMLIVLSALLIFYYVILPHLLQHALNESEMSFLYVEMVNPIGNSVTLSAEATFANVNTMGLSGSIAPADMTMSFQGSQIGTFATQQINLADGQRTFSMNTVLYVTSTETFNAFSNQMIEHETAIMEMRGQIDVSVRFLGRSWTFDSLTLDKFLSVPGLNGLPALVVDSLDVITQGDQLVALLTGSLFNPSIVSILPLGNLSFIVSYNGSDIGYLDGQTVNLYSGNNSLSLSGVIQPSNIAIFDAMISQYLLGEPFMLSARGAPGHSCSIPLYAPTVGNITLHASVNLPRIDLGWEVSMHIDPVRTFIDWIVTGGKDLIVPTAVKFHNPFQAQIYITGIELYVTFNGTECGYSFTNIDSKGRPLNISVPGNSTSWSETVPVALDGNSSTKWAALVSSIANEAEHCIVLLGLYGRVNITVGNLKLSPYYQQSENIPTCFNLWPQKCDTYVQTHHSFTNNAISNSAALSNSAASPWPPLPPLPWPLPSWCVANATASSSTGLAH